MAKIVLVGPVKPYRGGISHFNDCLIESLEASNYEVKVISWRRRYPAFLYPGRSQYDVDQHTFITGDPKFLLDVYNPMTWFKARKVISKENPDLLILHWVTPFLAIILRILLGSKVKRTLLICHNVLPHEKRIIDKTLAKWVFRRVDHFIVHAEEEASLLKEIVKAPDVQIGFHPRYSFFAKNVTSWNLRERYNIESKVRCLLYFGYIRRYKGVNYLVESLRLLKNDQDVRYHLFIVGEIWEGGKELLQQITKLGLKTCTTVVDAYVSDEDVGSYFIGADLIVLPYISATQSGVAQIAFSFDKPVVITKVGGLKNLEKSNCNVMMAEPSNASSIKDAIIKYFERNIETEDKVKPSLYQDSSWQQYVKLIQNILN